jgi:hypothetical protein
MTRSRAAIAAAVVAIAMALSGAGIVHVGHTKATKVALDRFRSNDEPQPGSEMP